MGGNFSNNEEIWMGKKNKSWWNITDDFKLDKKKTKGWCEHTKPGMTGIRIHYGSEPYEFWESTLHVHFKYCPICGKKKPK